MEGIDIQAIVKQAIEEFTTAEQAKTEIQELDSGKNGKKVTTAAIWWNQRRPAC